MDAIFELIHNILYIQVGKKIFGPSFGEDGDKAPVWQKAFIFVLVFTIVMAMIFVFYKISNY